MDLYRQALQTYGKLFQISKSFFKLTTIFKIIVALGINACVEGDAFMLMHKHAVFFFRDLPIPIILPVQIPHNVPLQIP